VSSSITGPSARGHQAVDRRARPRVVRPSTRARWTTLWPTGPALLTTTSWLVSVDALLTARRPFLEIGGSRCTLATGRPE